ncbi:gag/pol/env polyprotein, putative [Perkinsus marinus ATCC 50983]|uniref:Gag/pol/env polyprotein, putative n=1 Tax=Perkinsus marinus (strain ATCC 50983 / TXsc) TaxID=423536 RepID=C5KFK5_PERM5|nr:gag/pol/env polyprotein, putative [Perkinsus marinus ATCC 50983]EER16754.1 gag/pol/env polyprotein, putative [Perkinsus marinus ATCC 50983]|eukprot:XP_002784958.1 gag/pol/env polyprotein, putative [Perkinsus marinus ATCC 50983]
MTGGNKEDARPQKIAPEGSYISGTVKVPQKPTPKVPHASATEAEVTSPDKSFEDLPSAGSEPSIQHHAFQDNLLSRSPSFNSTAARPSKDSSSSDSHASHKYEDRPDETKAAHVSTPSFRPGEAGRLPSSDVKVSVVDIPYKTGNQTDQHLPQGQTSKTEGLYGSPIALPISNLNYANGQYGQPPLQAPTVDHANGQYGQPPLQAPTVDHANGQYGQPPLQVPTVDYANGQYGQYPLQRLHLGPVNAQCGHYPVQVPYGPLSIPYVGSDLPVSTDARGDGRRGLSFYPASHSRPAVMGNVYGATSSLPWQEYGNGPLPVPPLTGQNPSCAPPSRAPVPFQDIGYGTTGPHPQYALYGPPPQLGHQGTVPAQVPTHHHNPLAGGDYSGVHQFSGQSYNPYAKEFLTESQLRDTNRRVESLIALWRKDHQPFTGGQGSSVPKLIHDWTTFCSTQWLGVTDPPAVRAFMGGALSVKLSADIKAAYESCRVADFCSRSYHHSLMHYALAYIRAHHSAPVSATHILQKFLANKQNGRPLSVFLDEIETATWEMRFIFESNQHAPLDIGYIASSIIIGLDEPHNGTFYDEIKSRYGEGMPNTFDGLADVLRALRRRVFVLSTGMSTGLKKSVPQHQLQPLVNQVSAVPGGSTASVKTLEGAEDPPQQHSDHRKKQSKSDFCKRCYKGAHSEEACTADEPKDLSVRCRCGSRRHAVDKCPLDQAKVKCSRCLGAEGLPQQQPHRSGVCPYSLQQIQKAGSGGQSATAKAVNPSPAAAHAKSVLIVDGHVTGGSHGAQPHIPYPEIYAVDIGAQVKLSSVAVSQELRSPISVAYPDCAASVTASCLWDSGATATLVRRDVIQLLDERSQLPALSRVMSVSPTVGSTPTTEAILADNRTRISIQGTCRLRLATRNATAELDVFIVDQLGCPIILGVPTLAALRVTLSFSDSSISITTGQQPRESSTLPIVGQSATMEVASLNAETSSIQTVPDLPPSQLSAVLHQRLLPCTTPSDCITIETTRSGRYAVNFKSDKLEKVAGSGWSATVARARRCTSRKSGSELRLIQQALDKLKASHGVSTLTLRSLSVPPPKSAIAKLYSGNELIKHTHLCQGDWLHRHHPVFVPSQFVLKPSSVSTPCRIVFDCREVNKVLSKPNTTRWDLLHYLTYSCTVPVVSYGDLAKAFNQVLLTSRSAGTCCTVLRSPDSGLFTLVVWCVMPFGASPSPGGLELSTAYIALESRDLYSQLAPRFDDVSPNGTLRLPEFYQHRDFDHARPVLESAFNDSPEIRSALSATLPEDLGWRDYVDDWSWGLYHVRQLHWAKSVFTGVARFRGFSYAEGKENDSWQVGSDAPLLGYHLRDDRLCTVIDVPDLAFGATKRDVSKCLSSHYDPLGRHIELSMYSRGIWRRVVSSINTSAVATDLSWRCRVSTELIEEVNDWLRLARAAPPTPRYIPLHSGPFCDIPCCIAISCDASNAAWATDTRSRLGGGPLSPRLRGRGGMFPAPACVSTSSLSAEATIPRKELHALVQAAAEAHYLCSTLGLDRRLGTEIYIMSDSLINIQRLSWLAGKSKDAASVHIGKKGKHRFSENDLNKLIQVREHLWRCVIPVTIIHVPSALNLADNASRCLPVSPTSSQLRLLELLLDRPFERPRYVPPSGPDEKIDDLSDAVPACGEDELFDDGDEPTLFIGAIHDNARPGAIPPPFQQDDSLPVFSAEEEESLDTELQRLVSLDAFYSAIVSYLKDGTVNPPFSPARIRRVSACYQLDDRNRLYKVTLQTPTGDIIRQRVVVATGAGRKLTYRLVVTKHILWNHLGTKKLTLKLAREYFWKRMEASVRSAVATCLPCVRANATRRFRSSAGVRNVQSLRPFMVVGIDLYLPGLRSDDREHRNRSPGTDVTAMLLITCTATGFIKACVIRGSVTAQTVCECLEATFSSSIFPSIVLSDNDAKFCAQVTQRWCRSRHIVHCFAPVYSPLLCLWERGHREVTKLLRACVEDKINYGEKAWHTIVLECVNVLNGSPYGSTTWLSPRMLAFPYFSESEYYGGDPSTDEILNKMSMFTSPAEAKKLRDEGRSSYRLKLLHYLQHWETYRQASRARVLADQGRECDLQANDQVYHLTNASASAKLASRVQGPYKVDSLEPGRATAILSSPNGSKFRAWVGNLIKVPSNEFVDSVPTTPPCPWSLDGLPPVAVLPPPPRPVPTWPPTFLTNSTTSTSTTMPPNNAMSANSSSPVLPVVSAPLQESSTTAQPQSYNPNAMWPFNDSDTVAASSLEPNSACPPTTEDMEVVIPDYLPL